MITSREFTKRANEKRRHSEKRGSRVDELDIGSFITILVPRKDGHNCDSLRPPGIVVDKKGGTNRQGQVNISSDQIYSKQK